MVKLSAEEKAAKAEAKAAAKAEREEAKALKGSWAAAVKEAREGIAGIKAIGRKGFVCQSTGAVDLQRRTQLRLPKKDGFSTVGSFVNLPVMLDFLHRFMSDGAFELVSQFNLKSYNQPNVPNPRLMNEEAALHWSMIPGTESWEEYKAKLADKKATKAAKPADPAAELKEVPKAAGKKAAKATAARKSSINIEAGTSVIVKPTHNLEKAIVKLAGFEQQAKARARLAKQGDYTHELEGSVLIERSLAHSEKSKPNPFFPGTYGSVLVTTARSLKLQHHDAVAQ